MEEFYYYLCNNNITVYNVEESLLKLNQDKLELIINESLDIINRVTVINESQFNYTSNSELGGGRTPCSGLGCRIANLDKLSRFSVLYGDSVLIENPLKRYRKIKNFDIKTRKEIIDDLKIIYHLNPLLNSGLIKLVDTKKQLCPDCYERLVKDNKTFGRKLEQIKKSLNNEYIKNITYKYKKMQGRDVIEVMGPDELIAHGKINRIIIKTRIKELQNIFDKQAEYVFSQKDIKDFNLQASFCNNIIEDLINQHFYGNEYSTNYVTNRNLDINLIKGTNNAEMNTRCNAYLKGLEHTVPYLHDISLDDLVALRESEEEAFLVYRDSINEVLKATDGTSEKEIAEAFNDYVIKELHRVNYAVKRGKERLNKKLKKDLIVGGALVTAGLLSTMLPSNIPEIIAGMGGLGYLHCVGSDVIDIFSECEEVQNSNLYFLWKVKELGK